MKKIGIIGAGNIGCAIAKGLVNHGEMAPSEIYPFQEEESNYWLKSRRRDM